MGEHGKPSLLDLANMVHEDTNVNPDGTLAPRTGPPPVTVSKALFPSFPKLKNLLFQKPDETMGLLELTRDFWLALFKANQDPNLRDPVQRQIAELLKITAQKYVRTGKNAAMSSASQVDARASRMLIQKLRAAPTVSTEFVLERGFGGAVRKKGRGVGFFFLLMIFLSFQVRANPAQMAALDKLEKAEMTGRPPTPKDLLEIFEALGKGVPMTPEMLRAILEVSFDLIYLSRY